ncbi:type I-F CRISPR-associated endonuclease Cas1f, partial [Acinetobacter baumannii]|nr:type I-F CRISPR-associated endonuclease Cas1f [Acinetobacter baumannii]
FAGSEVEWLTPQSEYRPTEYMQGWMSFWFDETKRLDVAKAFQFARIEFIRKIWAKDKDLKDEGFYLDNLDIQQALNGFEKKIPNMTKVGDLLLAEAQTTKQLYKIAATRCKLSFERNPEQGDLANDFLNHGNYLAYGLSATTLWVLGISHSFAVMHGKTRRGALVFDVADLIKDAVVLPWAFICAKEGATEQEFRQQLLQKFTDYRCLDWMFDQVKLQACKSFPNLESEL